MSDVLVLGAGVIGLTTAIALQQRGAAVELWTRDDPLATTSAVAAAIWYPFLAEPRERVLGWAATTFAALQRLAADPASGVRMVRVREVFAAAEPDLSALRAAPGLRWLPPHELPPGAAAAVELEVPLCDTRSYLPWLLQRVQAGGGTVRRRTVASLREACAASRTVVNCTGLGARELCGDAELVAVRGQILRVPAPRVPLPFAWIDDTGAEPFYVVPRGDDVVLGGTAQRGDERLAADRGDEARIRAAAARRFPELAGAPATAAVGLRPFRSTVRLEAEPRPDGGRLVHSYGHGGSGFTVAQGCAAEAAALAVGAAG